MPKRVCIQGLGFVGAAMAVAVASARSNDGHPLYQVTGVDQDTEAGRERVAMLGRGEFPFRIIDQSLVETLSRCRAQGNLSTTTDVSAYDEADVVVVDIPLDIPFFDDVPQFDTADFEEAFRSVVRRVPAGALILVETTVPPGTCERILKPILIEELDGRGLDISAVHLAHSYERVMPGENYLESITHFWRVYAGITLRAADTCEAFLSTIIDVERYPLARLSSTTASETAKLMENTYRAANIAFIDEWTKYSETIGIDLHEIIDAIRVRPTHSNIRFPGIGVGGYCLTKDPAFVPAAARQIFAKPDLEFPFSLLSLKINQAMPLHAVNRLKILLGNKFQGKNVMLLGVSYRQDIGDTRHSPVEKFARELIQAGSQVQAYDPFVSYWPEMDMSLPTVMPPPSSFDAVVFTTPHQQLNELNLVSWLDGCRPVILDTVNVVSKSQRERCRSIGIQIESIGRGEGL
jgi:UDP-N-acetyl-D-glucosamine dehydrogenase